MSRRYHYVPGHPKANDRGFVEDSEMGDWKDQTKQANHAPLLSGRFYEGTQSPIDGSDIGSRRKHQDHMKQHNVTMTTDFAGDWEKAQKQREEIRSGENDKRERKEQIERAIYEKFQR